MQKNIPDKKACAVIKNWILKHRCVVEPDHQVERYEWIRRNSECNILSIGCGEAKVEEYVLLDDNGNVMSNNDICGAEISEEYIRRAKMRWPNGTFANVDITKDKIPWNDSAFQTVIMAEILEHIPPFYFHGALAEALRVCKKNVLVTVPNGSYCNNRPDMVYSSDHSLIMTYEVLNNLLNPPEDAKKWWIDTGKAHHRFNYKYEITESSGSEFMFIKIKKGV